MGGKAGKEDRFTEQLYQEKEKAMVKDMARRVTAVLRDEHGIETLEWIAMAFLIIVLVAVVAYPGGLLAAIQGVIANIVAAL